ncbi:MAG TPA: ATP-binding protein [Candidatus Polarisedimenticolia bacterium]|nr:ATP-binding protein [Candidatus Polarisedimenticolia bacterium]
MRIPPLSIRAKVIIIVAGTLIAANAVATLIVRNVVYKYVVTQKIATVEILAASFVHDVKYEVDPSKEGTTQDVIAKYMTYYRNIRAISFYDPSGRDVADSDPVRIGTSPSDVELRQALNAAKPSTHVIQERGSALGIRSVSPILRGSKITGAATIEISFDDINQALATVDRSIILLQVLKTLVVCVALYILIRQVILARVTRLTHATHRIAQGEYGISVPDGSKDEIAELTSALNRMSADLKRSREELDQYNRELEHKVREKTAALQKTYEDLKNAQGHLVLNEKMASLGVLIAGVAHEINTPVGAILNVSRNLARMLATLPQSLAPFWYGPISPVAMESCLEDLRAANATNESVSSYRETKQVERLLEEHKVEDAKQRATVLARIQFTDPELLRRNLECVSDASFLKLADAYGSIAQGVAIAETSSQKIAEIVRALKYYARSDTDRVEPIQINESIHIALVLLRNHLKNRVMVETDLAPNLPPVRGTGELNQIWTNLLTNACDAVEEVGPDHQGSIRVTTRRDGDRILVAITDNGVGIPEVKLQKVFDPFYTTKDIGKGTGLGLSIVSGIVAKLGGAVAVKSRPGETTFEVSLRLAQDAAEREGTERAA